jgi:hypothetical protein
MTQIAILAPLLTMFAVVMMIVRNRIENSKRQAVRVEVRKEPELPPKRIAVDFKRN